MVASRLGQLPENERYHLTENGIAIHEPYTVTLLSAEEAVLLSDWLNRHYVRLYRA